MSETKTSYLSPATATLEVSAVRSLEPSASITLDLGIPNFTVFSIKFPLPEDKRAFPELAGEALGVMLDEMAAFMLSMGYRQGVIAKVYALAMDCYKGMQGQEAPEEREPTIGTVRGEFPLPTEFVNETQKQVVTAAKRRAPTTFEELIAEEERREPPVHIFRTKSIALCGKRSPYTWAFPDDATFEHEHDGVQHRYNAKITCPKCRRVYEKQHGVRLAAETGQPPEAVLRFAEGKRQGVASHQCGNTWVIDDNGNKIEASNPTAPKAGWWVETHTIGCRNAADEPEEEWWNSHFSIYEEYSNDGRSTVLGDPDEGRFVTITPWGTGKAAGKEVRRMPVQRRMEFTHERPKLPSKSDILKAIRRYRFQSIRNTPRPLYLVVYDQQGNPKGTLSLGPGFHNDLLKMQYGKKAGTLDLDEIIRAGGGAFKGVGEDGRGGEMAYFDNPANSSTLVLPVDKDLTPEAVRRKIEWNNSLSRRNAAATCEFCKAPSVGCVVNYAQPEGPFLGSAVHVCEAHRGQGEDPRAAQTVFVSNRWERQPGEGRVPYPEFSKRKEAGQWGMRSWDGDSIHDILDRFRPTPSEGKTQGFDEPISPENLPKLLDYLKAMDRSTPDGRQQYLGVAAFLLEHGSEVPDDVRRAALEAAGMLLEDLRRGEQGWKDPRAREREIRREMSLLKGVAKEGRFLRIEEMRAWGRGEQDRYYAEHPELERIGRAKQARAYLDQIARAHPDWDAATVRAQSDLVRQGVKELEEVLRPDAEAGYSDEQGYWVGSGNAASGVLPVCTSTGRVCLAWRSPHVNQGNCWGTIGGAVKEGMTPEASARHELSEETGYRGSLSLHPAYTFKSGKFSYRNYIGEVGHEFDLRPQGDSAWETEALEWGGLDEWMREARAKPGDFHPDVLALLRESGGLIRSICGKAEGRKTENGEPA
jgi:8-oxo-dGTP pyrophosphatase MutT (NUDIX family)